MKPKPIDLTKAEITHEGLRLQIAIEGDPILEVTFIREESGSLTYIVQEDAEDDRVALWNILPEYFEEVSA
jgi:hypothetical protein